MYPTTMELPESFEWSKLPEMSQVMPATRSNVARDSEMAFNISVEAGDAAYEHLNVKKQREDIFLYPVTCPESPGYANDPDYIPDLVSYLNNDILMLYVLKNSNYTYWISKTF